MRKQLSSLPPLRSLLTLQTFRPYHPGCLRGGRARPDVGSRARNVMRKQLSSLPPLRSLLTLQTGRPPASYHPVVYHLGRLWLEMDALYPGYLRGGRVRDFILGLLDNGLHLPLPAAWPFMPWVHQSPWPCMPVRTAVDFGPSANTILAVSGAGACAP